MIVQIKYVYRILINMQLHNSAVIDITLVAEVGLEYAATYVSISKSLSIGYTREWFLQKFKFCSNPNGWDEAKKVKKLPTLLGEALAAWMEFTEEVKRDFSMVKEKLIKNLVPLKFLLLEKF